MYPGRYVGVQINRGWEMTEVLDCNDRIKKIRLDKKLKHADISVITGYSPNTVKKWLTDPNSKHYQIAPVQALKLMEQWLLDGAVKESTFEKSILSTALAEVWALTNHKGGSGKTTATINFALMLSRQKSEVNPTRNNNVLIVDADFQQNATKSLAPFEVKLSISDLLRMHDSGKSYKYKKSDVSYDGLSVDLLSATNTMSSDVAGIEGHDLVFALKEILEWFKPHYDYILIDGLPSKGSWYVSVIAAADKVVIPFKPNKFDVWGVSDVFEHVKKLKIRGINNKVRVAAVFCSDVARPYRVLDKVILEEIEERYPEYFCPVTIRSTIKVKEGCDAFPPQSIAEYDPKHEVSDEYRKVLDFIKKAN